MLHTFQQLVLWGKFRSLNRRYNSLLEQAKSEGNGLTTIHVEETFWYETAILLEQRRRLQASKAIPSSMPSHLPSPTIFPKRTLAEFPQPHTPYLFTQQPPSGLFILLFSILGSLALGTGAYWLLP